MRKVQFTLFSLLLASQSALAELQFNLPEGVTPLSHDIYHLHMTTLGMCTGLAVIVFVPLIYILFHHRKSVHPIPAEFHEYRGLEITWTLIPVFILVCMAIPGTLVTIHLNNADKPDMTVKVTGYQWKWRYEYLDQKIQFFSNIATPYAQMHNLAPKDNSYLRTVDHPLVLPIHKKVRFLITSNDVIHSWWVPMLGIKRDAVPGFITESWTRINKPGVYYGQCSELCGINHAFMPVVIVALGEKDFENWLVVQHGGKPTTPLPILTGAPAMPAAKPTVWNKETLMQNGEQVFLSICAACHKPDGSGSPPTFPALKGDHIVKGPLKEHLNTVLNGKPGTAMQAFRDQLSDEDLASVITYERNAFGNNTGDIIMPAQIKAAKAGQ